MGAIEAGRRDEAAPSRRPAADVGGDWRARVLVGTCSWTDHEGFYPPGTKPTDRIAAYARRFPLVEVNSSFHNPLPAATYAGWTERTPEGFTFNVKAYSALTLHRPDEPPTPERFAAFRASYRPLVDAGKLGAVLFQFPPRFDASEPNRAHLARVAEAMVGETSVVEFRHRSWLAPERAAETLDLLARLGLGHVVADAPEGAVGAMPTVVAATTPALAYARLHGRGQEAPPGDTSAPADRRDYRYEAAELEGLAGMARELADRARVVHVLFNNQRRYSAPNAESLRRLLGQLDRPPESDLGRQLPLLGG